GLRPPLRNDPLAVLDLPVRPGGVDHEVESAIVTLAPRRRDHVDGGVHAALVSLSWILARDVRAEDRVPGRAPHGAATAAHAPPHRPVCMARWYSLSRSRSSRASTWSRSAVVATLAGRAVAGVPSMAKSMSPAATTSS